MGHVRVLCLKMYSEIQFNRYLLRVFWQGMLPGAVPEMNKNVLYSWGAFSGAHSLVSSAWARLQPPFTLSWASVCSAQLAQLHVAALFIIKTDMLKRYNRFCVKSWVCREIDSVRSWHRSLRWLVGCVTVRKRSPFIYDWPRLGHLPNAMAKAGTECWEPSRGPREKRFLGGKTNRGHLELEKKVTNVMEDLKCHTKKLGTLGLLVEI